MDQLKAASSLVRELYEQIDLIGREGEETRVLFDQW